MTHCSKKGGHIFVHHPARNVCAKFKVNRLSDLRTGARQKCSPPRNLSLEKFD